MAWNEARSGKGNQKGARSQANSRQTGKSRGCSRINSRLIAVAESGNLSLLVSTIEEELAQMNLVNFSTAFHRLAKLSAKRPDTIIKLKNHPVLPGMVDIVRQFILTKEVGTSPFQALSNITWALATLEYVDLHLLSMLAALAHEHTHEFKPFELSSILWAFASFRSANLAACECAKPLFEKVAKILARNTQGYSFRCLVMIAWAFAQAGHHDVALFSALAQPLVVMTATEAANSGDLANLAWAYGEAGVCAEELFANIAQRSLQQFLTLPAQDFTNLLWGCANARFFHEGLFEAAATRLQQMDFQCEQLAKVMWAFSTVRPKHRAARNAVLELLPRCTVDIQGFSLIELASVSLSVSKCFGRSSFEPIDANSQARAMASLPRAVLQFFVTLLPIAVNHLAHFSEHSLASVASAFLVLQLGVDTDFFPALGHEVVRRTKSLPSSTLLIFLRNLPVAPVGSCGFAVQTLFAEAAGRVQHGLCPKDLETLSRICTRLQGHPVSRVLSREQLEHHCRALSEERTTMCNTTQSEVASTGDLSDNNRPDMSSDESEDLNRQVGVKSTTALGPPLAFIDAGRVDSEKLNTWRTEYRQYRTGASKGSRGEICSSTSKITKPASSEQAVQVAGAFKVVQLPPALNIIPSSVPQEKLAAFRCDYQNFRKGNGQGARGELSAAESTVCVAKIDDEPYFIPLSLLGARYPPSCGAALGASEVGGPSVLSGGSSSSSAASPREQQESLTPWRVSVKNTFLDIEDRESARFETSSWSLTSRLGEPLSIIPSDISMDKLETYRIDYQRFRAGQAVGAKGEVREATLADRLGLNGC